MNQENFLSDLIEELEDFTLSDAEITENTVPEDVLSSVQGADEMSEVDEFGDVIKVLIYRQDGDPAKLPSDWMKKTLLQISQLSFMLMLFLMLAFTSKAQVEFNASAVKTPLGQNAVSLIVNYVQSLDSLYGGKEKVMVRNTSLLSFTPSFNFQYGTSDALNSLTAKLTGRLFVFKNKIARSGDTIPDLTKTYFFFPFSAGIEGDAQLRFLDYIVEVGAIPVFRGSHNQIIRRMKLGAFLQSGYKSKLSSKIDSTDQSQEALNSGLFRAKGVFGIDTKSLVKFSFVNIGLVGTANVWYDFLNHAVYHQIQGTVRFYLSQDKFFDFDYQHGSGAPLYTQGNQWGGGLTIVF